MNIYARYFNQEALVHDYDEEIAAEVKKILDEKVAENETMEVKKFLFGSIELTSLHTEDTEESILKMIEKVKWDALYALAVELLQESMTLRPLIRKLKRSGRRKTDGLVTRSAQHIRM